MQSNIGILRQSFIEAKNKYDFKIIAICVLKNHVHMLIKPANINEYPLIIKEIKIYFSKNIDITTIKDYNLSKARYKKVKKIYGNADIGNIQLLIRKIYINI